jgi:hypothetical protein
MYKSLRGAAVTVSLLTLLSTTSAFAASDADVTAIRKDIQQIRASYAGRITELEAKLAKVESKQKLQTKEGDSPAMMSRGRRIFDNDFNPSIGVILNGNFSSFSESSSEIKGFGVGEEGERGKEGISLGESELNLSANVDDKFYGHITAAFVQEGGEDKVEVEEAYVQTTGDELLPRGLTAKAGRAFWTLGYLNEHHSHYDDFADRPLPYRVFLNKTFNDDGIELSYVLPTDIYTEIGGGAFRGDGFPGGTANGEGVGSYSAFARVGGDVGDNQSWRVGASWLGSQSKGRATNEGTVNFIGDTDLYIVDLRYTWAPTGNSRDQEVMLQGEYFLRNEDGTYADTGAGTGLVNFDDSSSGLYGQAVYKFQQPWRVGYRHTRLNAPDVPTSLVGSVLDSNGHAPYINSVMLDWTNSEFSRLRFQYSHDNVSANKADNQFMLQYVMSIGAHGAHKF